MNEIEDLNEGKLTLEHLTEENNNLDNNSNYINYEIKDDDNIYNNNNNNSYQKNENQNKIFNIQKNETENLNTKNNNTYESNNDEINYQNNNNNNNNTNFNNERFNENLTNQNYQLSNKFTFNDGNFLDSQINDNIQKQINDNNMFLDQKIRNNQFNSFSNESSATGTNYHYNVHTERNEKFSPSNNLDNNINNNLDFIEKNSNCKIKNNEYMSGIMSLNDKKILIQKKNSDSKLNSKLYNDDNSMSNDLNYSEDENYINNYNENKNNKKKEKSKNLSRQHSESKFELTILSKKSYNDEDEENSRNLFKKLKEKHNKIMLDEGTQYFDEFEYNKKIKYNTLNQDNNNKNYNEILNNNNKYNTLNHDNNNNELLNNNKYNTLNQDNNINNNELLNSNKYNTLNQDNNNNNELLNNDKYNTINEDKINNNNNYELFNNNNEYINNNNNDFLNSNNTNNKMYDLKKYQRKSIFDSNISENRTSYSKKNESSRSSYNNIFVRNPSKKSFLLNYEKGLSHNSSSTNFFNRNLHSINKENNEDDSFYKIQPKIKVFDHQNYNNDLYSKIPHHNKNEFWNIRNDKKNKSRKNSFIFVKNNSYIDNNNNDNINLLSDYQIKENVEKYKKKNIKLSKKNKDKDTFIMPPNPYKTVLEAREFFFFNEK